VLSQNDPHFRELKWQEVVARTWFDPDFKKRVITDPLAALREAGIQIPEGIEVVVAEETPERWVFVLPCRPQEVSLSDLESAQDNLERPNSCISTGGAGTAHVIEYFEDPPDHE
jgi:hypothetical protein